MHENTFQGETLSTPNFPRREQEQSISLLSKHAIIVSLQQTHDIDQLHRPGRGITSALLPEIFTPAYKLNMLCSALLLRLDRTPFPYRRRSNMDLVAREILLLATPKYDRPSPAGRTPVRFQTKNEHRSPVSSPPHRNAACWRMIFFARLAQYT